MPVFSMAIAGDRISLVGNINNPVTLYSKGPEQVRDEVWKDLGAGVQLIAPECAVPLDMPTDNLREIPRAVEAWHTDHAASGH
jgi:[methyl-Co(III) methanol-specific corrinoid protein]:coenzyme M methyltransferase